MDTVVSAVLSLDLERQDLTDRLLVMALRSLQRHCPSTERAARDLQDHISAACQASSVESRDLRTALGELLALVESYNRREPRAALTFLHSLAN